MLDLIVTVAKQFLVVYYLCVSCGCEFENVQVASEVDTSQQVLVDCSPLVTRCCT